MAKKTARKKTARKKTARKKAARKTAKKTTRKATRKTAKKASSARAGGRITPARGKPRTKSEVLTTISDQTGVPKRDVAAVFETMQEMIAADLKKGSAGVFNVPGMMKVTVQRKPATKARKGINPFTGEEQMFKAKPARNVVKIRPLKGLKDAV